MNRTTKCLTLLSAALAAAPALFGQTATWNGLVNASWNNAANWTWSNGANAIPDATTDVIIGSGVPNTLNISGDLVHCKNMQLSGELNIEGSGVLNIHGTSLSMPPGGMSGMINSVESGTGQYALNTKINFIGNHEITIDGVYISTARIGIDCDNLKLNNNTELDVLKEIFFLRSPVALGSPAKGNLIIDTTSLLLLDPLVQYFSSSSTLGPFTQPHIITTRNIISENDFFGCIAVFDLINEEGLNGTVQIPVSASDKAFNFVQVRHLGGDYAWLISSTKGLPETCTNNVLNNDDAVQNIYNIFALGNGLETTISTPAQIMIAFDRRSLTEDVLTGFNPLNGYVKMHSVNDNGCYDLLTASTSDTTLHPYLTSVYSSTTTKVGKFILAPVTPSSLRDPSEIEGLNIYPNPVKQSLSLSLSASHNPMKAKLLNVLGQTVWSTEFKANALQQVYTINTGSLPAGTYILQLQSDKQYTSRTVIKQ